jgi:hypothetical protein
MFRARPARASFLSPHERACWRGALACWLLTEISRHDEAAGKSPRHDIPVALPAACYPNTFKSRPISHFP